MRLHPDDISAIAAEVARRITTEDLNAIRQIIREEVRAALGTPLAQMPSLDQLAAKNLEIKMRELAEKRAKRAAKAATKKANK